MESSSAQSLSTILVHLNLNYDTNAALTQIQAKVAQVRNDLPPEAEAPIIELEMADNQFAALYLELLVEGPRSEPDHRLPDARRAAEAERGQRRAARRHPRRPHLRDAHLAEAGEDGRAGHLAGGAARGAGAQQLPVGARPDQGLDGVGQPRRQHRPAHGRGVPPAGGEGAERRRRPPRRDRRRRARRRELRGGRPLQRRDRGVHGHLGAADRQLAGRHPSGCAPSCRASRRSCRPA